jgi:phenylalanyl-tRNA synthetase alpha chain
MTLKDALTGLSQAKKQAEADIAASAMTGTLLKEQITGKTSAFGIAAGQLKDLPVEDRKAFGQAVNEQKIALLASCAAKTEATTDAPLSIDVTEPGTRPPVGHLHIVSQAIMEITDIFSHIGFTRVRHPEVDWDWYPFESLNMPKNHPARDEWETFFIQYPGVPSTDERKQKIVLTPHTSNGQVREMEKGILPIRMINIAKCYRRQIDVSHTPMFHQFEGLYIDRGVGIGHLTGVFDYFVKSFFGPDRRVRLRPFHFQFTEPSFEIDISCGVCGGTGILPEKTPCKLCKSGWLELGGAGMVHPTVLKNGGIDPAEYSGFAFGWGVERTYMMKGGTQLDDIRLLYSNDVRFLEQF